MTSKKEMMENAIVGSQKVLAEYIVPDSSLTAEQAINKLLEILDNQEFVRAMRGKDEPPHVNPTFEEIAACDSFEIAWPPDLMEKMNEWGSLRMLETDLALRMGFKVTIKN